MKVYTGSIETYWECGDEHSNNSSIIGIFDSPEKAYNAVMERLYYDYKYDSNTDTYYGDYADEAWVEIWEFELNEMESLGIMKKDNDGNWYNETKKNLEDCYEHR